MSRYDGLIIPRSYSEYISKTDAATLQQALQLSGVLSRAVAAGDNKAVTSNAVNGALANYTVCSTGLTQDANIAFSLAPTNNGKTTYYICNKNTPNGKFWWNIEAVCSNVYGNNFIFQKASQCGGNHESYTRESSDRGNSWTDWKKITTNGSSPTFQDVIINGTFNLNVTHTDTYINMSDKSNKVYFLVVWNDKTNCCYLVNKKTSHEITLTKLFGDAYVTTNNYNVWFNISVGTSNPCDYLMF